MLGRNININHGRIDYSPLARAGEIGGRGLANAGAHTAQGIRSVGQGLAQGLEQYHARQKEKAIKFGQMQPLLGNPAVMKRVMADEDTAKIVEQLQGGKDVNLNKMTQVHSAVMSAHALNQDQAKAQQQQVENARETRKLNQADQRIAQGSRQLDQGTRGLDQRAVEIGMRQQAAFDEAKNRRIITQDELDALKKGGWEGEADPLGDGTYELVSLKIGGKPLVSVNTGDMVPSAMDQFSNKVVKSAGDALMHIRFGTGGENTPSIPVLLDERDAIKEMDEILQRGQLATGATAKIEYNWKRLVSVLKGEPDPDVEEHEVYAANAVLRTGKIIRLFGSGTGLSDADRDFALGAAGGKETMTLGALKRINGLAKRAYSNIMFRYDRDLTNYIKSGGEVGNQATMNQAERLLRMSQEDIDFFKTTHAPAARVKQWDPATGTLK